MFIIHLDSQAEKQLPVLEKKLGKVFGPKIWTKSNARCWETRLLLGVKLWTERATVDFRSFYRKHAKHSSPGYWPRDIMVFIYHSGRRLVESGQMIVFEREATFFPTFFDTFVLWLENEKLYTSVQRHQWWLHTRGCPRSEFNPEKQQRKKPNSVLGF